ncbi:hypothetical protein A8924_3915 [Saccharopolyspora erythraea NRRL 2338]|uniref:Uncharacterized protein n=2 Tax=Saccharopolyspora erythraea TaxID=1836 RepID=A4FFH1_SACEN|nr:hypothetical protein [Saccharopolyspora erythraea]EQD82115.1 hypothetical protein N599_32470 [Saccharopolyspora erythraea D]PFG96517.1 hypothetical protein A8924_3915 [Saccharopolyspora erythraea NRRL 2338]QRK93008.1 hypothetical protein JQX30_17990 [Saccharopolyspora erythraea]CAM02796.1 hypothetical protein SACE_3522 [Saccharopolyspora erythraea NRRL 2338]
MRKGRRGHPCDPDTSRIGLWRCDQCGQQWEIHGVEGDVRVRRVSRVAQFFMWLLG